MTSASRLEWSDLRAPELKALAQRNAIVVLPVGSTEQHGPHLPVQVDALLAGEVALRAARKVADAATPVVVAPTVWSGLAEHHMVFGGTFTLDHATFSALLRCICRSVIRHGFRRIFLLNGHGGNMTSLDVIAAELSIELGRPIVAGTYWMLAEKAFGEILEVQPNVLHACEAETSMLLAIKPQLVDTSALDQAAGPWSPSFWVEFMRAPSRWRSWAEVTPNGVIGVPAAASAQKGMRLLDAAAEAVARTLLSEKLWT